MKLVSKAWHGLIHQFREDKTATNTPRDPSLLILGKNLSGLHLWDKKLGTTKIKTPAKNLRDRAGIVLSCNGLLCILTPPENLTWSWEFQVSVYNPLTRRDYILPYLKPPTKPVYVHFGFGFHRGGINNEYKVVGVVGFAGNNLVVIHDVVVIRVSKLGSWRSVVAEKPVCFFERSSDVVVDGSIHWLCKERADSLFSRVIVAFDLAEEKFQQIATPVQEMSLLSVLAELGGRLVLTVPQMATWQLDIWMMNKDDGDTKCWTKQYVIGPNGVPFSMLDIGPVCQLKDGGIVVSDDNKALYVYYPDRWWHFEAVATIPLRRLRQFKAIQYKPVLFSPQ